MKPTSDHVNTNEINLELTRFDKWCNQFYQLCERYKVSGVYSKTAINPANYKHNLVIWVHWGDLMLDFAVIKRLNDDFAQCRKKVFVISDCFFDREIILSNLILISEPKFIALAIEPGKPVGHQAEKTKLFNCFINRVDKTRQSWFYHLHNRNLLDKGYVSFLLFQIYKTDAQALFESNHKKGLNTLPAFEKAFNDLKDVVPFKNFEDNGDLTPYVLDSKYSLVLDTYAVFDDYFAVYFSEKVVRSLITPCIDLIFAQKGAYTVLNKYGFQFCEELLKLDSLGWIQRQIAILNILQNDSISVDNNQLYKHAVHNKNLFTDWYNDVTSEHFIENLITRAVEQTYPNGLQGNKL